MAAARGISVSWSSVYMVLSRLLSIQPIILANIGCIVLNVRSIVGAAASLLRQMGAALRRRRTLEAM